MTSLAAGYGPSCDARTQLLASFGLWRHGDYLRLWSAQGISALGSQITLVALPLTAILILDATTFEIAVLTAVEFLPFLLLSIPAESGWTGCAAV
jgi:multisubunit Na+/H+ antiporter MnhG subunit